MARSSASGSVSASSPAAMTSWWTFWQYTGTGTAPGFSGNVDLNAFAGSRAQWNRWLAARVQR